MFTGPLEAKALPERLRATWVPNQPQLWAQNSKQAIGIYGFEFKVFGSGFGPFAVVGLVAFDFLAYYIPYVFPEVRLTVSICLPQETGQVSPASGRVSECRIAGIFSFKKFHSLGV